jgi:hypothetical protein
MSDEVFEAETPNSPAQFLLSAAQELRTLDTRVGIASLHGG